MSVRLPRFSLLAPLALGLLLSAGCQSTGMVSSIDDLTAQVDQEGFLTLQQQRLVALSGLIPEGAPGSLYRFRGSRSPFTAIGVSHLPNPAKPLQRHSFYVTREIQSNATDAELVSLRDKLVDVRLAAAKLIRTRIERVGERTKKAPDTQRISQLTNDVETAQTDFDTKWKDVVAEVKHKGLMIVRTDRSSSVSLGAKIGAILGLSSAKDEEVGGFAILADLRTSFLYLGNDLEEAHWPKPYGREWNLIGTRFPFVLGLAKWPLLPIELPILGQLHYEDMQVVTSKFEARRVLYLRDQLTESRIQADIKASVDQLRNLNDTLEEIEEVAIEGVLASVESLGNVGIVGEATQTVTLLGPTPAPGVQVPVWQSMYEVLSDYDDLRTFTEGRWRLHLTNFF